LNFVSIIVEAAIVESIMNKILLALFVTDSMLSTASAWAGKSDQVIR